MLTPKCRQDWRHQSLVHGEETESEMLGTELGVVPGLRLTQAVPPARHGAWAVREKTPPVQRRIHGGVRRGQAGPSGGGLADVDEGSWPEGRLDLGAHGAGIDPDGS